MLTIAEKLGFVKARAVEVCIKRVILSNLGFQNLVFRINLQENCLITGKS